MTDRDALVLTLIRGLEGAALALDVVDDATHQQIGGLLSPKARRLLAALTAPAPATPTAEAAANDAPAAASEEAPEPPAKKPAVFGVPAAAFVVTSFDDLPEDALGAIASFSDIKTLTCVATCRALRDAAAKLRPRLEHSLVLKRFPLLTTLEISPTGALAPHELFRTFAGYSDGDSRRPPRSQPTTALDDYTFLLEFFLWDRKTKNKDRSVFVTTGTLSRRGSPNHSKLRVYDTGSNHGRRGAPPPAHIIQGEDRGHAPSQWAAAVCQPILRRNRRF